jgi:uncharacterized membrane protein HdeD (DUF308 family)
MTTLGYQDEVGSGADPPIRQLADALSRRWWVPLVSGLALFVFGLAILAADWTVKALVVTTGLLFVVRGVALVFSPQHAAASSGEHVVVGLIGVVAGLVLIAWPGPTLLVLAFFVGTWLAVAGAFHMVSSLARRSQLPHWGITLAMGAVELLLGIWVMRRPDVTLDLVITILGIWAVLSGVALCVLAFEIRRNVAADEQGDVIDVRDTEATLARLDQLRGAGLLPEEDYAALTASVRRNPGH